MRRIVGAIALTLVLAASAAQPALAAPSGGKGGGSGSALGADISWPQCGNAYPAGQAFGIVGVNDGLATTTNPCLADQLAWAAKSRGTTAQPKVQLYVNTANPGGLGTPSWPGPSTSVTPYGTCDGSDSLACAWQYGWNRAQEDVDLRFSPAASAAGVATNPAAYTWWLDVELGNTWKTGGTAAEQASNRAVLEGMTDHLVSSRGARVGLYATASQWATIAGTVPAGSHLIGLDNWRPVGSSQRNAQLACSAAPLTAGGRVTLTQFVSGGVDYDISCIG